MFCPFCGNQETKVVDSRLAGDGYQTRRRRECIKCTERFTTFESAELLLPKLIKRDKSREPFDESKLRDERYDLAMHLVTAAKFDCSVYNFGNA